MFLLMHTGMNSATCSETTGDRLANSMVSTLLFSSQTQVSQCSSWSVCLLWVTIGGFFFPDCETLQLSRVSENKYIHTADR